jgi:hypothetical protein
MGSLRCPTAPRRKASLSPLWRRPRKAPG